MNKTINRSVAAAATTAVLLSLAACGGEDSAQDPPTGAAVDVALDDLDGRSFGTGGPASVLQSRTLDGTDELSVRVSFEGDRIDVHGGCNGLSGTAAISDATLTTTQMSMTEMACDQPLMDLEAWLADFLAAAPSIALEDDVLVLSAGDERLELPEVQSDVSADDLDGTWRLEALVASTEDGLSGAASGVGSDSYDATLTIEGDELLVDSGCNTGSATLSVKGDTWATGPLAMTRKGCRPATAKVERQIVSVLGSSPTFTVADGVLTLTASDGQGLQFRAAATP